MIILIDTNVILDIVEHRVQFFEESYRIVQLSADEDIDCILSASAVTDVYYLAKRNFRDDKKALEAVVTVSGLVKICDTKSVDIEQAIKLPIADFEDAVVAAVAQRERASFIITRNINDFSKSPIPAIMPSDFLKKYVDKIV